MLVKLNPSVKTYEKRRRVRLIRFKDKKLLSPTSFLLPVQALNNLVGYNFITNFTYNIKSNCG